MNPEQPGTAAQLCEAARSQATILSRQGKLPQALQILEGAERQARKVNDKESLAPVLNDKAGVLRFLDRFEQALSVLEEYENLVRATGNADGIQVCIGNQALLLRELALKDGDKSKIARAMKLNREKREICEREGIINGTQFAIGTEALLHRDLGDLMTARTLWQQQASLLREMGHREELARCLLNIAMLKIEMGSPSDATPEIDEAQTIAAALKSVPLQEYAEQVKLIQRFQSIL